MNELWLNIQWDKLQDETRIEEQKACKEGVKLSPKHLFRRINREYLTNTH